MDGCVCVCVCGLDAGLYWFLVQHQLREFYFYFYFFSPTKNVGGCRCRVGGGGERRFVFLLGGQQDAMRLFFLLAKKRRRRGHLPENSLKEKGRRKTDSSSLPLIASFFLLQVFFFFLSFLEKWKNKLMAFFNARTNRWRSSAQAPPIIYQSIDDMMREIWNFHSGGSPSTLWPYIAVVWDDTIESPKISCHTAHSLHWLRITDGCFLFIQFNPIPPAVATFRQRRFHAGVEIISQRHSTNALNPPHFIFYGRDYLKVLIVCY